MNKNFCGFMGNKSTFSSIYKLKGAITVVREDFSTIVRKIRIFSGVVLFAYVIMHLSNHSLNIFSIELADNVRKNYFSVI